jgi:hypothetical protein
MQNGPIDTKSEFGSLAHTLRARKHLRDRFGSASFPLRHLLRSYPKTSGRLRETMQRWIMEEAERLTDLRVGAVGAPSIKTKGCSPSSPDLDHAGLRLTGERAR